MKIIQQYTMPQPLRTKIHAQLAATLQISQFKSDTLQTMGYSLSTPSIFFYLYDHNYTIIHIVQHIRVTNTPGIHNY